MASYEGWKNKETWLVDVWYMDHLPEYFTSMEQYHVQPHEVEEAVTCMVEDESVVLCQLPSGLLSDFIETCWREVDWWAITDWLNDKLADCLKDTKEG